MTYIHAPVRVVLQDRNEVRVEIDNSERVVPIPSGAQGLPGEPGFSPVVSVEPITGGNRVTITDEEGDNTFDVMNGTQGEQGEPGEGVPTGGVTGQVLKKRTNTDYDTYWANESGGVTSVNGQTGDVVLTIPTKTSDLTNDSGFVNASGASSAAPVQSVNGMTGAVVVNDVGTISMSASWSGSNPYTQTVTVSGATVTANSKVDLQPDASTLAQLINDGVSALFIVNNNGTLTAYAVGAAPSSALTLQCVVTEVVL